MKTVLTISILLFSGFFRIHAQLYSTNCLIFRTGKFTYKDPDYDDTIIIRSKKKQIEKTKGEGKLVYKIEWVSDCEYHLTFIKSVRRGAVQKPGDMIKVQIIEAGKYSYVYYTVVDGKEYSMTIIMTD